MKLRYTPAAVYDLQQIEVYIRDTLHNPSAAVHTITRIADAVALLKEQPNRGGELKEKLNREIVGRYLIIGKHLVIYEVGEFVSIIRVLDTRTDYCKALFR